MTAACRAAGIDRQTAYNAHAADPDFVSAWDEALEQACDDLELEARRRGKDGVNEPVIYKGELMGLWVNARGDVVPEGTKGAKYQPLTVKKYSDTLIIFLLKANRPEKYRENMKIEHAGEVRVKVSAEELTDDELAAIIRAG